ncbi:MAG: hypothetical protein Fur0022_43450 [Anaerolineales bacterium]
MVYLFTSLLVIIFLSIILARVYLLVAVVEQTSMSPTLLDGERVLVLRKWPPSWLQKGQIVLIRLSPKSKTYFIKRVVGLPGEILTTNFSAIESHRPFRRRELFDKNGKRTWNIPTGHFFVMGENNSSEDSRDWGPNPFDDLVGLVLINLSRKFVPIRNQVTETEYLPELGEPAPGFTAEDLNGNSVSLARYLGCNLILLFVSPLSPPSLRILSNIETVNLRATQLGSKLLIISIGTIIEARKFVNELDINLPVLIVSSSQSFLKQAYNLQVLPFYYSIDDQGLIQNAGHPSTDLLNFTWEA